MNVFFNPDNKMVEFLIKLSDDRLIVDFGTGDGTLLSKFLDNGKNDVIGFDCFVDILDVMERDLRLASKVLPYDINEPLAKKLLEGMNTAKPCVGLLCRPCHHPLLIDTTYDLCKAHNMPLYYIGLERNVSTDLSHYDYEIIPHEGRSIQNEIVIKLL